MIKKHPHSASFKPENVNVKQVLQLVFGKPELVLNQSGRMEIVFPYTCMASLRRKYSNKIINLEILKYKLFVQIESVQINFSKQEFTRNAHANGFHTLLKEIFPEVKRHVCRSMKAGCLKDGDSLIIHPVRKTKSRSFQEISDDSLPGYTLMVIRPVLSPTHRVAKANPGLSNKME